MRWQVKYSQRGYVWDLDFPPTLPDVTTDVFQGCGTMADVLAEAIEWWLPNPHGWETAAQ